MAQEAALPLQAKLRAAAAQVATLTEARDEAISEAEAVHRDLAELQDDRSRDSHLLQVRSKSSSSFALQGYLANKKQPPPPGPP